MTVDDRRQLWRTQIELSEIEEVGKRFPLLQVLIFERNELGEKRYVGQTIVDLNEAVIAWADPA